METENKFKYFAFISYKREDEEWAKWLQHKLEHYKLPSNLNGRTDLPKEIRPIFRDQSDLAGGVLADEINKALESSKFLIVICSPRAAQSEWVGKEVQTFLDLGRADMIIPFIIGGTAYAQDPKDECFPLALRELPPHQELLGVNINEMGRDAAAVKVVAQMFGLQFDELWQRHEREQRRKRLLIIVGALLLALIGVSVAMRFSRQNKWIQKQNEQILHQQDSLESANWKMMENQARFVAEKTDNIVEEDSYLARILAVEVLPNDLNHPERPYTPEAEATLRNAIDYNSAILRGHTSEINTALFSPDGKRIVSASYDGTVRIWDVDSGAEIKVLEGHASNVTSATYSPDGKRIVSGSWDNTIRIWDAESGKQIKVLVEQTYSVASVSFSPDGKWIVSASDFDITIWDAESGKEIKILRGTFVHSPSFSPDGKHIVAASNDIITIWDVESGKEIKTLKSNSYDSYEHVTSVSFSPDGKRIVSTSKNSTIRIWNAELGTEINVFGGGNTNWSFSAAFSPDGKRIVSGSANTITIWDAESGTEIKALKGHPHAHNPVFSPDGKRIVSPSYNGTIRIWDAEPATEIKVLKGHSNDLFDFDDYDLYDRYSPDDIKAASFSPNGKCIVSFSNYDTITIWDIESGTKVKVLEDYYVLSASFSPDGKRIVSTSNSLFPIKIWDAETGAKIKELKEDLSVKCVESASFSPDGKLIVSTSKSNSITILDAESGRKIIVLNRRSGPFKFNTSASFSPDGKYIIAPSYDTIKIWDAESGIEIKTLEGHASIVTSASFSHDGNYIVSASRDGTVRIWDAEAGAEIKVLKHSEESSYYPVNSAVFSPDGKYIVSASWDKAVKIWDVKSGAVVKVIELEGFSYYNTASFSPDGNFIISTSCNGTVRIWPFQPLQELIDQTRERFKDRPLTDEERRLFYLEK